MKPEIRKYLYDIQICIISIESYLGDKRIFGEYQKNKMLRRAVEREFEIIGEAMNKIHKIDPNVEISSKHQIIGVRNRVIHGYDKIDDEIVWGIIIRHLPILKKEVERLLV
ncbi:MAG: HepT-like ribonuclease domain-containing protein [Bacteroidota bacterium]